MVWVCFGGLHTSKRKVFGSLGYITNQQTKKVGFRYDSGSSSAEMSAKHWRRAALEEASVMAEKKSWSFAALAGQNARKR